MRFRALFGIVYCYASNPKRSDNNLYTDRIANDPMKNIASKTTEYPMFSNVVYCFFIILWCLFAPENPAFVSVRGVGLLGLLGYWFFNDCTNFFLVSAQPIHSPCSLYKFQPWSFPVSMHTSLIKSNVLPPSVIWYSPFLIFIVFIIVVFVWYRIVAMV